MHSAHGVTAFQVSGHTSSTYVLGKETVTVTIVNIALLLVGLLALAKGADAFVEGAGGLAARLGIPPLVVGLTIVALGTSAPEAAISITSATQSAEGMAIAGVFGSNIVNTLVILGITALVVEVPMRRTTMRYEIPFVLIMTAALLVLCVHDGQLGRIDSMLLLLLFAGYLVYLARIAKASAHGSKHEADTPQAPKPLARLVFLCAIGAIGICVGARLTVDGATHIAHALGMSDRVVGLTVIAMGTSLPELVTSLTAARKGQADIAIGNVVGSSIFNVLFVLGVSGVITPLPFASELLLDGVVALAAIALLWFVCLRRSKLGRVGGVTLLSGYAIYLGTILAA